MSKGLQSAKFAFIRHDSHRTPLQPAYDGPFKVLEGGTKIFVVDMGGEPERATVVDGLKPAHLDLNEPVELTLPPHWGLTQPWPQYSSQALKSPRILDPLPAEQTFFDHLICPTR